MLLMGDRSEQYCYGLPGRRTLHSVDAYCGAAQFQEDVGPHRHRHPSRSQRHRDHTKQVALLLTRASMNAAAFLGTELLTFKVCELRARLMGIGQKLGIRLWTPIIFPGTAGDLL